MLIFTDMYGIEIDAPPKTAYCLCEHNKLSKMDYCPSYEFDEDGEICCPSLCEDYSED